MVDLQRRSSQWRCRDVRRKWQCQRKRRSNALDAFESQISLHRAGQLPADGQTQTDALLCFGRQVSVDLYEGLEHPLYVQQTNADTCVSDTDSHSARIIVASDPDAAAFGSELDRV